MAKRNKKTVVAEGQLSLFSMFMSESLEISVDNEEKQSTYVNQGSQSKEVGYGYSYNNEYTVRVSETPGDQPAIWVRDDSNQPEYGNGRNTRIPSSTRRGNSREGNGSLDQQEWLQGREGNSLRIHAERDARGSSEDGLLRRDGGLSSRSGSTLERSGSPDDGSVETQLGVDAGLHGEDSNHRAIPQNGTRDSDRGDSTREVVTLDTRTLDLQIANGPLERTRKNIAALKVLNELDISGEVPTPNQAKVLAGYSGWGGAQEAFDKNFTSQTWAELYNTLHDAFDDDKYVAARSSTLTAFYTPRPVVEAMWKMLKDSGVGVAHRAHVLEPGCGTGNFMRAVPADIDVDVTGIEIDPTSARIAKYLERPQDNVVNAAFEDVGIADGSFDAVVGNVPYSRDIRIQDGARSVAIHDYFISRSIKAVKPGGVVALITSRYTLDKVGTEERQELAKQAEYLGAVRLPEETFATQAGTSVISDVIVLRRREKVLNEVPEEAQKWLDTTEFIENGNAITINAALAENIQVHTVGTLEVGMGPFGFAPRIHLENASAEDIGSSLYNNFARQISAEKLEEVVSFMNKGKALPAPIVSQKPNKVDSYELMLADDGGIWYGTEDVVESFEPRSIKDLPRVRALLSLRDATRSLLADEKNPELKDDVINAKISELNKQYEEFVKQYGRLSDATNRRCLQQNKYQDSSITTTLLSLEELREDKFVDKAAILKKRVVAPPAPVPEHVNSPTDAIAICVNENGNLVEERLASLLNVPVSALDGVLGDAVVRDPSTKQLVLADEYLSGDVESKLEYIRSQIDATEHSLVRRREQVWRQQIELPTRLTRNLSAAHEVQNNMEFYQTYGVYQAFVNPLSAADVSMTTTDYDLVRTFIQRMRNGAAQTQRNYLLQHIIETADKNPDGTYLVPNTILAALSASLYSNIYSARLSVNEPENNASWALWKVLDVFGDHKDQIELMVERVLSPLAKNSDVYIVRALQKSLGISLDPDTNTNASFVDALMAHKNVGEYLFGLEIREMLDTASVEGLASFEARRAEVVRVNPGEIDGERLNSLRHIEKRLLEVRPKQLNHNEIVAALGNTWIPPYIIMDFMRETFGLQSAAFYQLSNFQVTYSELTGRWKVKGEPLSIPFELRNAFGTNDKSPFELVESILNASNIQMTKPEIQPDGTYKNIPDPVATKLAWDKRDAISQAFKDWVWKDPKRTKLLEQQYNSRFNRLVNRRYRGDLFEFPGISTDIKLRDHQKAAVAHVLQSEEGTLLAHVVGAGKTFEGIVAMHEAKRLGRSTKPLCVIPNSLTEQFAADWLRLYPDAKLLIMNKSDTQGSTSMQEFWGRARSGDWDGIIVGHTRFTMLKLSPKLQEQAMQERVNSLVEDIELLRSKSGEKSFTVKQAEKLLEKTKRDLAKLHKNDKAEQGIYFDDLGIDMLVVDEAHEFKNLAVTGIDISGMSTSGSAKADDLYFKCNWMRSRGLGKNIVFMTGTPVTNSMGELYNLQRFLAPNTLKTNNTENFISWALTFGQIGQVMEQRPEGGGFRNVTRFKLFQNLPELMKLFHTFGDVVTKDMVNLDLPKLHKQTVTVEADFTQTEAIEELIVRAEKVHNGLVAPTVDNMLKITSDGRKVALDPKLLKDVSEEQKPLAYNKVQVCAENIFEEYKRGNSSKTTQLVFCDTSTDAAEGFNIYDDLRRRLYELGIPRSEVASIGDINTNQVKQKQALIDKVNAGDIRVLIGSTVKLGTGTNVQKRLSAVHHLDCPWRPSDLEQRNGRIERQGNTNSDVFAYYYTTVGSFDAYMYQLVERKQRFISQVFTSKTPERVAEDVDEVALDYQKLVEASLNDPRAAKLFELRNTVDTLRLEYQGYLDTKQTYENKIRGLWEPKLNELQDHYNRLLKHADDFVKALDVPAPIDEDTVTNLRDQFLGTDVGHQKIGIVGQYRDLNVVKKVVPAINLLDPPSVYIGIMPRWESDIKQAHFAARPIYKNSAHGRILLSQLDDLIAVEAKGTSLVEDELNQLKSELSGARQIVSKAWDKKELLEEKQVELVKLERALSENAVQENQPSAVEVEEQMPDSSIEAPTAAQVRASVQAARANNEQGTAMRYVNPTQHHSW